MTDPGAGTLKSMMHRRMRRLAWFAGLAAVSCGILAGPAATWLEAREYRAGPGAPWDAVYLVAGARAQERRLHGLTNWLQAVTLATRMADEDNPGQRGKPVILIGHDPQTGPWSRRHQRNLTRSEWALERIGSLQSVDAGRAPESTGVAASGHPVYLVTGLVSNTDSEMERLGDYLRVNPDCRRLALVTSPFHARRTILRAIAHIPPDLKVGIVPGACSWEDRAPWVVAGELLKMIRDAIGLSRSPGLSR